MIFAVHNVLRDPPFSRLDLVSCRNLLIYLDRAAQQQVLEMFHFALRPGGYLFLGSSETVDVASRLFTPVDKVHRHLPRQSGRPAAAAAAPRLRDLGRGDRRGAKAGRQPPSATRPPTPAEVHRELLEEFAPPSVLVTAEHEIVHVSPAPRATSAMPRASRRTTCCRRCRPELRQELRTALFQALQLAGPGRRRAGADARSTASDAFGADVGAAGAPRRLARRRCCWSCSTRRRPSDDERAAAAPARTIR